MFTVCHFSPYIIHHMYYVFHGLEITNVIKNTIFKMSLNSPEMNRKLWTEIFHGYGLDDF